MWIIFFLLFSSLVYAQVPSGRITPWVTEAELAIWKCRVGLGTPGCSSHCPDGGATCYVNAGDVQTNSPGEWSLIVTKSNEFKANPAQERYTGPVGADCPLTRAEGETPGAGFNRGNRMTASAFRWLMTNDTTFLTPVKNELLTMAGAGNLNWTIAIHQCHDGSADIDYGQWMHKLLEAYSFTRHSTTYTAGNRTTLDTWFLNYINRKYTSIRNDIEDRFVDRYDGNYTIDGSFTTCPATGTLFVRRVPLWTNANGTSSDPPYYRCIFHQVWENVRMSNMLLIAHFGILTNNANYIAEAKRYIKEFHRYGLWPDGAVGETFRWGDGIKIKGMNYSGGDLFQMAQITDLLARFGDSELYTNTTTAGHLSSQVTSEGTTKSLKAALLEYGGRCRGTISKYPGAVVANDKLDCDMEACCNFSSNFDILASVIASKWYDLQGDGSAATIKGQYLRTNGGPAYVIGFDQPCGTGAASFIGNVCAFFGLMLRNAGMEGHVDPYDSQIVPLRPQFASCRAEAAALDEVLLEVSNPNSGTIQGNAGFTSSAGAVTGVVCGTIAPSSTPGCTITLDTPTAPPSFTLTYNEGTGNVTDGTQELTAFTAETCTVNTQQIPTVENTVSNTPGNAGRPYSTVVDGVVNFSTETDSWVVDCATPPCTMEAVIDLGAALTISANIVSGDNDGTKRCETVALHSDATCTQSYTEEVSGACNARQEFTHTFTPVSSRCWKMVVSDDRSGASTGVQLFGWNMQVSGEDPPDPPAPENLAVSQTLGVDILGVIP